MLTIFLLCKCPLSSRSSISQHRCFSRKQLNYVKQKRVSKIIRYYLARESRLKIQDSRFKKKSMKMHFKKKHQILENQIMCPQQSYYKDFISYKKFTLSNAGAFHENSLSVVCCIFGMLEIRTLTPNRFKNQSSDTLNILGQNYNH